LFESAGWTQVPAGRVTVPVWPTARHWRPFSLEIETPEPRDAAGRLRTLTYDFECSFSLRVGQRKLDPQRHTPRQWVAWPLTAGETNATFTLCIEGIPLLSGNTGRWLPPTKPPETTPPPAARRWVLCTPDASPSCLASPPVRARLLAATGAGESCLAPLAFDLWSGHPADLPSLESGTAVIFLLDRHAFVRGVAPEEAYRRLSTLCGQMAAQASIPILAIGPDVDLGSPLQREQALALARVRDEFGCRLVDLREPNPQTAQSLAIRYGGL
jgi:hypothetical protein